MVRGYVGGASGCCDMALTYRRACRASAGRAPPDRDQAAVTAASRAVPEDDRRWRFEPRSCAYFKNICGIVGDNS